MKLFDLKTTNDKGWKPKPSGRLLTDEITKILEAWQDTDTDYVVVHSFKGVANEVSRLFDTRIEALIEEIEKDYGGYESNGKPCIIIHKGVWESFKATHLKGEEG